MSSPFYLVGPTAVGKTAVAVAIAERCGAEIVSADAFQVYNGLDLLTGKPSLEQLRRVPHHLISTIPIETDYNVSRFAEEARNSLADIAARGHPALVVGGSGLYVRALTHGLSVLPPASPELRAKLQNWDLPKLLAYLHTLDPAAVEMIDTRNPRRLIRAIEICAMTGGHFSDHRAHWQTQPSALLNGICLTRERTDLQQRIEQRVDAMVESGVIDEITGSLGTRFSQTADKIIGLSDFRAYLSTGGELQECLRAIKTRTRQYAKRQMTWFRNKSGFAQWNLSERSAEHLIEHVVNRIVQGRQ